MSLAVALHLLHERLSWRLPPRVPEPELVMQSPQQTEAFFEAGRANGALAFLYLYNSLHISALLRPGDRVLDLACGPANQLGQVAQLNPNVKFIGLDMSSSMLARARATLVDAAITNVELVQGDISQLDQLPDTFPDTFPDASLDVVMCTMSLHHLPELASLHRTLVGLKRVLKPGGRIYLIDFGRLKNRSTQNFFALDLQQSAQFTEDYFNSLRAAFSADELTQAVAALEAQMGAKLERHVTVLAPFLVMFRSAAAQALDAATLQRARAIYAGLSAAQQSNFRGLTQWMERSGVTLPRDITK